MQRVPIIDVTDLYHPAQDPGDNFDIVTAYALPEIDLRAVVLDVTDKFRNPYTYDDNPWKRDIMGHAKEPGFIPMTQMNAVFGRRVPHAAGPFRPMRSQDDPLDDVPPFQQQGIELIIDTLRASDEPMEIVSFGSARAIAAAFNREPDLLRRRVKRVHLSAGSTSRHFLEWNVLLDPHAIVRLLTSGLPVAIYPCATGDGPFAYGRHNSFWKLERLDFIRQMDAKLRRYLVYALGRSTRADFLRALEQEPDEAVLSAVCAISHNVWETAVWMEAANRKLVRRENSDCRIVPATEVLPGDEVLPGGLKPCSVSVYPDGSYTFEPVEDRRETGFWIYDRGDDPYANEAALREALPALYVSFRTI
ncbi:nucleoside hydrolase [Paenibacillaceae bacterium WGS1546]|uniref:nucleoside hydrolase n=1 Tax=Cohnella sp. WGS1546 TaxID=3366810 RepID=UPI00372D2601